MATGFSAKPKGKGMRGMFDSLYGSQASQNFLKSNIDAGEVPEEILRAQWGAAQANPLKRNVPIGDIGGVPMADALSEAGLDASVGNVSGLGTTMGALGQNIKAHPMMSAGIGILGAGNIAGLFDDNKIGGQLAGGIAGGVLPGLLGSTAGPAGRAMMALGGGQLGALFDKLRAKKELEQQQATQMSQIQGGY